MDRMAAIVAGSAGGLIGRLLSQSNRPFEYLARLSRTQLEALLLIDEFRMRLGGSPFAGVDRDTVARELEQRVDRPWLINQVNMNLCGPAVFMFSLASSNPVAYVQFVIDLFETGHARLNDLEIIPGTDCLQNARSSERAAQADWIALASIRDQFNTFLDYEGPGAWLEGLAGLTMADRLAEWFRKAGFSPVEDETNGLTVFTKNRENLDKASQRRREGWFVCLLVDPDMVTGQSTWFGRHWIALTSDVVYFEDGGVPFARFDVFTWGDGYRQVNRKLEDIIDNYYGYVAAHP